MKYNKKFTIVVMVAVASLLLAGTILAPAQSYASMGSFSDNSSPRDGQHGNIRADLENTDQNINQENVCFRSNICRQSDVGQNTQGNDNQVTGFADQSDNNQQSTTANKTSPTPTPTPTPTTATLTVIKIVSGRTTGTPSNFTMHVTGNNPIPANFAGSSAGIDVTLGAGAFAVTETGPTSAFNTTTTGDCTGTIASGQHLTCTITNTAKTCVECFTSLLTTTQIAELIVLTQGRADTLEALCNALASGTLTLSNLSTLLNTLLPDDPDRASLILNCVRAALG
jgi:hypothetical protein